jgi:hypothetical protein
VTADFSPPILVKDFEMIAVTGRPLHIELADFREADLARRVTDSLWSASLPVLRRISVEARGETVVLRGAVDSFYQRQMTVARAACVPGIRRLVDALQVTAPRTQAATRGLR